MSFHVPAYATGSGSGFKVSASDVAGRDSFFSCPMGQALMARKKAGTLYPNDRSRWRSTFDKASTLNFALRDLTYAQHRGGDTNAEIAANDELTDAQRHFLRHAMAMLAELMPEASSDAGVELTLADEGISSPTQLDGADGEVTAFGRHLASADGSVHELVRMRFKPLRAARDEDADWTAVAALALAYTAGVPASARIRISEFSLADGEYRLAFDGDRERARSGYTERGRPVGAVLTEGAFNPGQACSRCAFLNVCPAVPQKRGLLGLPERAVATRYLRASDLAAYDYCPTAFHAERVDHLPDGYDDDTYATDRLVARARGNAVHAWLRWAHSRAPARGCISEDLPAPDEPGSDAAAAAAGLDEGSYRLAYPYLLQHVTDCPLRLDGLEGWNLERRVTCFDPDADIVVTCTPDLTCTVSGSNVPIWRETKTAAVAPSDIEQALWHYPGFALTVVLLAHDAPAVYPDAHVELEVLTPEQSVVLHLATSDGELIALAQKIVAGIARSFAGDLAFDRKPNAGCASCAMHRWCDPPAPAQAAVRQVIEDDEFGDHEPPF